MSRPVDAWTPLFALVTFLSVTPAADRATLAGAEKSMDARAEDR